MRKRFGLVLLVVFSLVLSCKNKKEDPVREKLKIYASIEKYDSLDWFKDQDFKKINPSEKSKKFNQISRFYQKYWQKSNASGGLLVAQNGQILFENYSGFSDFGNQTAITADTPLHIASISKVLTSLAILKLVEFKKLNLTDKASKYLEGFPYTDVSIENLMSHRSGLPNYLSLSDDKNYWDNTQMMTNQDVLNLLIQKKPEASAPGKAFAYNNTNFVLLALIIEKITGLTYPEAMKVMVFEPLGMTNTFVMEFDKDASKVSKSYYNNMREWAYDHLDKTYGDKNIYSTPRDLLKMDIAMYSPRFLPKELKDLAWKGYSNEKKGVKNYGLGFRMYQWDNGDKVIYHTGKWHGTQSIYIRDFSNEVCIIAIGNRLNRNIYNSKSLLTYFDDYPIPSPDSNAIDSTDGMVAKKKGNSATTAVGEDSN